VKLTQANANKICSPSIGMCVLAYVDRLNAVFLRGIFLHRRSMDMLIAKKYTTFKCSEALPVVRLPLLVSIPGGKIPEEGVEFAL